jgi:nitrite reductase/ring-hydroxylating ferredoxin subunit
MKIERTEPATETNLKHACVHMDRCGLRPAGPEAVFNAEQALSRRSFVRTFALMSAASWLGGKELKSLLVADVAAQSSALPGIFRMNLDNNAFAALRNEAGSVRLTVAGMPTSFAQIIVSRLEDSQFFAVTSRCTHQQNPVSPMNLNTRVLVCPTHGSQFAPDGTLLVPAGAGQGPLTSYPITFDGVKTLSIEIPNLGFVATVGSAVNPSNSQKRVRLEFPTVSGVRYDVQFRPALTGGGWSRVPFASTIDGAANVNTLAGNNQKATVFVDPGSESGFYAIGRGVAA